MEVSAQMNESAFGSKVLKLWAISAMRGIPYLPTKSLQSLNLPNSRTRLTTKGALDSKSMESFSTSQKRKSEKEFMYSLSLIKDKYMN